MGVYYKALHKGILYNTRYGHTVRSLFVGKKVVYQMGAVGTIPRSVNRYALYDINAAA